MKSPRRYADRFSAVGQAGVDLLKAEASALTSELNTTSRTLLRVVVLIVTTAFFLFWAVAVTVYLAIEVGTLWLPRWAATLVTLALVVLSALTTALVARRMLRRLETPAAIVRRRLDDHRAWWKERFGQLPQAERSRRGAEETPVDAP